MDSKPQTCQMVVWGPDVVYTSLAGVLGLRHVHAETTAYNARLGNLCLIELAAGRHL